MSCSRPNLQQIPNEALRRYVRAPAGRVLVAADYAQAEVRILAKASGDPTLLEAFGAGKDSYRAAVGMFGVLEDEITKEQRSAAKGVVLSIVYGTAARGLAERLGTDGRAARGLIDRFFAAHPKVKAYLDETAEEALSTGEARTLIGRRRRFGVAAALRGAKRRAVGRRAKNFPMQGSCADGTKLALALLHERRHEFPGAVPIIALHDEIVVEGDAKEAKAWLEKAMLDGMDEVINGPGDGDPAVPIGVEVESGRTWAG
jgi:DNA polymerase-1